MARTTITTEGAIVYRSKNMPLSLASGFARCIEANASRFCDVAIVPSKAAEKYFVQFRPVNRERQGDLYEAQYNARADRAQAEGSDYIFWPDADNPGTDWCFNPLSGETYQVSLFDCTCADHVYRCAPAGLVCKHRHARQLQADAGTLGKTDKVTRPVKTEAERAERDARMKRMADLDF